MRCFFGRVMGDAVLGEQLVSSRVLEHLQLSNVRQADHEQRSRPGHSQRSASEERVLGGVAVESAEAARGRLAQTQIGQVFGRPKFHSADPEADLRLRSAVSPEDHYLRLRCVPALSAESGRSGQIHRLVDTADRSALRSLTIVVPANWYVTYLLVPEVIFAEYVQSDEWS